jgi:dolichol-phosphate mannosyltransferase
MRLSVLIPVFNEKGTLDEIIEKVRKVPISKELIIVDDCSTDGSRDILKKYEKDEDIQVIYHAQNSGKGKALRTALEYVRGDIVIVQDADLEYEPNDYLKLIRPIADKECSVIYGSRFLNSSNRHSYLRYYWGGRLVTLVANLLFSQNLTDEPTCYKVFTADLIKSLPLTCERFEFCPEVTAKIAKKGIRIREIPINYYPRKITEGKKIRWYDGVEAIWTLIKFRFTDN